MYPVYNGSPQLRGHRIPLPCAQEHCNVDKIIAHRKACTKYSIVFITALILINIIPKVLTEALVSLSHNRSTSFTGHIKACFTPISLSTG